jgi:D-alanyl-D-alanine-carboxypeptidase/D-alanyl-D-alanine-endopeptidase
MKRTLLALLIACATVAIAAPAIAQQAPGDWAGILEPTPGTRVPLIVHIARDQAGSFRGTLDCPSQGAVGLALAQITADAGRLAFAVPGVGGRYQAHWDVATMSWKGEWSQGGQQGELRFSAVPPPGPVPADWQLPPDTAIAKLIAERNAPRVGQGIVVGVLGPQGQRFVAGGTGAGAKVDRHTLFEIGSMSEVFTGLILADMANKGEVSLADPAAKYLPKGHHMPERGGRQITLRDLSTHRSGLPPLADDMDALDRLDGPFADYGEAKLLAFLDRYQLMHDIGSRWDRSSLGVGLLGYLLARAAHTDYETLLRNRITGPLGMKDTAITVSPAEAGRLAPPFDAYMRPAKPWDLGVFAGADGIHSSAADLLIFAGAVLDPQSPIAAAVKTALSVRLPVVAQQLDQALGWQVSHGGPGGGELWQGDGRTGGYRATLALEPAKGRAEVVLINSAAEPSAIDLGLHLLLGTTIFQTAPVPAAPPAPTKRTEIALPAAALDKFVGRYDFGNGVVVAVTRDGATLRVLREGMPEAQALPIFPEAPLAFFWKALDAQIRFTTDANGAVTGAVLAGKRVTP